MWLLNIGYRTDYELVRTYHPDSPASHALPSSVRHARFHAVTRAYDILRGRSNTHPGHNFGDDVYSAELARRRRQHARRQAFHQHTTSENAEAGGMSGAEDAWKDQVIIVVGLAVRHIHSPRRHV
jgi:DnaJ-class molecular chaperone